MHQLNKLYYPETNQALMIGARFLVDKLFANRKKKYIKYGQEYVFDESVM